MIGLPFGLLTAAGAFLLDLADNMFNGEDEFGFAVTCELNVLDTGEITWTGFDANPPESGHTWFSPIGGTDGTGWHVKLSFTSGTNQHSGLDPLATWLSIETISRSWRFNKAASGPGDSTFGVYLLEFSDDGGSTTHDSVSIDDIQLREQTP